MPPAVATANTHAIDSARDQELYRYRELSAPNHYIRLLRLQPGTRDQEITCELVEHNLSEENGFSYEALSWCWGNGARNHKIIIRCGVSTFASMIPQNLLEALMELRLEKSVRTLWVDALCINQEDPEEKSIQIPMMSPIYRRAEKVCIWLGQDEHDGLGIDFIKNEVLKLDSFNDLVQGTVTGDTWRAILDMLQAQWFLRRWILQEILFARDAVVYYGSESISWEDFADAISLFLKVQTSTNGISDIMHRDPQFYHVPGFFEYISSLGASILITISQSLFRIHPMAERFRYLAWKISRKQPPGDRRHLANFHAYDTSISSQSTIRWIDLGVKAYPVNYSQPYASHCKDFVEFIIKRRSQTDATKALDILCRPWAPISKEERKNGTSLPSWVSCLSNAAFDMYPMPGGLVQHVSRKNANPLVGPPNSTYYTANGNRGVELSSLQFDERPNHYSLNVLGFILDSVEHVELPSRGGCIPLKWVETYDPGRGGRDVASPDRFWRTLVADRGPSGGTAPAYYKRAYEEVMRKANLEPGLIDLTDFINHACSPLITDFCRRVQAVIWNRSMIRTSGGGLG
ncbi:heterokaryon incompatibility protein-domain-containing protein [Halenospora varia]|nr:heterokaryon incompatibility protein-domain-containing protein [Halenospora varia]